MTKIEKVRHYIDLLRKIEEGIVNDIPPGLFSSLRYILLEYADDLKGSPEYNIHTSDPFKE